MILDVRNDSVTLARDKAGKTNSHSAGSDVGDTGHVLGRGGKGNTPQDNKSFAAELWITYFALVATLLVITLLLRKLTGIYSNGLRSVNAWSVFEQSVFISLVLILIYGGIVYQLARIGYYKRLPSAPIRPT